jgi:anhydro-N-acetylmuramic acid kinase
MSKENYNVIGVMSGTSLDGVDLAHIQFKVNNKNWTFQITESETIGYSQSWINRLKLAVD